MAIGVIDYADPIGVFPLTLSKSFRRVVTYPIRMNEYANGETSRVSIADFSRRAWELAEQLTATNLALLRTFYLDHQGGVVPFYFYDPYETVPLFTPDPTGLELDGRYIGRFDVPWEQAVVIGRIGQVALRIMEIV